MSYRKYTVYVEPKPFDVKSEEIFIFQDIDCPSCECGQIKIFEDFLQYNEADTEICQRCQGTGKLKASITINWSADK